MRLLGCNQAFPKIGVLHRFFGRGLPSARLPAGNPVFVKGVHHVLRVGVQLYLAGALEGLERGDDAHEFHAVVGGALVAARELEHVLLAGRGGVAQYGAVASVSGVAARGAVGVDDDFQGSSCKVVCAGAIIRRYRGRHGGRSGAP